MTLFGNTVFTDVIKLSSYKIRISPNPMTGVLIKREKSDTDTERR